MHVRVTETTTPSEGALDRAEVDEQFFNAGGKGGQHRNRTVTDVRLVHRPSGITVIERGRSQWQNRQRAWTELERRVTARGLDVEAEARAAERSTQASGGHGRSFQWCAWRDEVKNLSTGQTRSMRRALRGNLDGLC